MTRSVTNAGLSSEYEPFTGIDRKNGIRIDCLDGVAIEAYVKGAASVVSPANIIAASRSKGAIMIYLKSDNDVTKLCVEGVQVGGAFHNVYSLENEPTRFIISNVPPYIPNFVIKRSLETYGKVIGSARAIPLGCKSPELRHVKSFRRQVQILIDKTVVPDYIDIAFAGKTHRVFISTDEIVCFRCHEKGHFQRTCPLRDVLEPVRDVSESHLSDNANVNNDTEFPRLGTITQTNNCSKTVTQSVSNGQRSPKRKAPKIKSDNRFEVLNSLDDNSVEVVVDRASTSDAGVPNSVQDMTENTSPTERNTIVATAKEQSSEQMSINEPAPISTQEIICAIDNNIAILEPKDSVVPFKPGHDPCNDVTIADPELPPISQDLILPDDHDDDSSDADSMSVVSEISDMTDFQESRDITYSLDDVKIFVESIKYSKKVVDRCKEFQPNLKLLMHQMFRLKKQHNTDSAFRLRVSKIVTKLHHSLRN